MKLSKICLAVFLSMAMILSANVSVFAATSSATGTNVEGAEDIQIIGLGGVYPVANANGVTVSFNAVIPSGFSAVRLYDEGTQRDFSITESSETNNYVISFGAADVKTIGANIIRIEADYSDGNGGTITKSAQKTMYAFAQMLTATTLLSQKFDSLSATFDTMTDAEKASAIGGSVTPDFKNVAVTNSAVENGLRGSKDNKALKFTYGGGDTAGLYFSTGAAYRTAYTTVLNFRFYASDTYSLDVMLNKNDDERMVLSGIQLNQWHDAAVIYDPAVQKATCYIDGTVSGFDIAETTGVTDVRLRATPQAEGGYVAIDDLSIIYYKGRLSNVDNLNYYTDDIANRVPATDGVVPSNTKGLLLDLSRGSSAADVAYVQLLDANGNDISSKVTIAYQKILKDVTGTVDKFYFEFFNSDGFTSGKYTAVVKPGAVLGGKAIQGFIRRDFYVMNATGLDLIPANCTYDGTSFQYDLSYARLADKNLVIILAVYNGNELSAVRIINSEEGYHEVSGSISAIGDKAKILAWNSMVDVKPVMETFDFTATK